MHWHLTAKRNTIIDSASLPLFFGILSVWQNYDTDGKYFYEVQTTAEFSLNCWLICKKHFKDFYNKCTKVIIHWPIRKHKISTISQSRFLLDIYCAYFVNSFIIHMIRNIACIMRYCFNNATGYPSLGGFTATRWPKKMEPTNLWKNCQLNFFFCSFLGHTTRICGYHTGSTGGSSSRTWTTAFNGCNQQDLPRQSFLGGTF